MYLSKSFTIECCVFCLCQVMLFACWFVVVVDSVLLSFYLFHSLPHVQSTSTVLCLYLCFYCAVFASNSAFNSDISKWNTGAVTSMSYSKSFTIECCVFCLCQLMLSVCVCLLLLLTAFFFLFIYSIHCHTSIKQKMCSVQ
jgi:surface protein